MVVSKHAIERGLERIFGVAKEDITDEHYSFMKKLLTEHITPRRDALMDGNKYLAQIKGYDNFRAVIKSDNGEQTLITIKPHK